MRESSTSSRAKRVLFAVVVWWLLAGTAGSWAFGLPFIILSVAAGVSLGPSGTWRLRELPRFFGFFLWHSLRGGVDVARRALHPRMPLAPGVFDFPLRLSEPAARVFFANTVSLLPGTLSADLNDRRLRVHVLDRRRVVPETLREVERRVAALFGLASDASTETPDA